MHFILVDYWCMISQLFVSIAIPEPIINFHLVICRSFASFKSFSLKGICLSHVLYTFLISDSSKLVCYPPNMAAPPQNALLFPFSIINLILIFNFFLNTTDIAISRTSWHPYFISRWSLPCCQRKKMSNFEQHGW